MFQKHDERYQQYSISESFTLGWLHRVEMDQEIWTEIHSCLRSPNIKMSHSYKGVAACTINWFSFYKGIHSLVSWNVVSSWWFELCLDVQELNEPIPFQRRIRSTTGRGDINQIGLENLYVLKHQALWWPLWFMLDAYPVSLATFLTCLFKVGGKEASEEIKQHRYFTLAPVSTKRMVKCHLGSCLSCLPVNLRSLSYC